MKSVLLLAAALFCLSTRAEESPVPEGVSPDQRYEIVAVMNSPDAGGPSLFLRRHGDKKVVLELGSGWAENLAALLNPEYQNLKCLWSSDSRYLAVYHKDEKRGGSMDVYRLDKAKAHKVSVPDPFPKILSGYGAKEVNRYAYEKVVRWEKDNALITAVTGDYTDPKTKDWFSFEYTASYSFSRAKPSLSLKQISHEKEEG
jgi:hypothetical protein